MDQNMQGSQLDRAAALLEANRGEEAEAMASQVAAAEPSSARAWFLTGAARHMQRRPEAALAAMEQALSLDPQMDEARQACATLLLGLKRPRAALAHIEELAGRHPGDARARTDAGIVLEESGDAMKALQRYDEALRLAPRDFRALLNRGALLLRLGRAEDALRDHLLLVKGYVGSAAAHANLGENLLCLRRYVEALAAFTRALAIDPGHMQSRMGRGLALSMLRQFVEAAGEFEKARRSDPGQAQGYFERAAAAAGLPQGQLPDTEPRLIFIHGALRDLADGMWTLRKELLAEVERLASETAAPEIHDRSLGFNMLALPLDQARQRAIARLVAATVQAPAITVRPVRQQHERLRIGYLSPDFRAHPTARNRWRLMQLHDREKFEVIALSLHSGDGGPERSRIEESCDCFVDLSKLDNAEAVARIALEEIDILVDIAGYTEFSRPEILASGAAPVRVQHMGTPGPCGGDFIDYRITDATMTPPGEAGLWDEKLVWLPDTCWTCDDTVSAMPPPARADCGLPERGFVFCCFNKHYKIEPDVFEVWMRLLRNVAGSVLWLLDDTPASKGNLRKAAEARGVSSERLVFARRCSIPEHVGRHVCADLFLDTLYYNAHTTAADALLAGLPVLTLPGASMAARVGASLVRAAGLPELVAQDLADYEAKALQLATNPADLARLKQALVRQRPTCPLFDLPRRTREIEAAYAEMWRRHAAGLGPQSFRVAPIDGIGT
jgi:protein O-GlcNAc transferase